MVYTSFWIPVRIERLQTIWKNFPAVMSAGSIGQVVNSRGPFDTGTAERPRSESTENHFLSEAFRPSAESADLSNGLLQSSK